MNILILIPPLPALPHVGRDLRLDVVILVEVIEIIALRDLGVGLPGHKFLWLVIQIRI